MASLPLAHISWAIADNADRAACDAFFIDLFGAETAYEMLVTPETAKYRFDREERLASFTGGIAPYAALPGRVIAGLLKGQGIGMGVNLGIAPSSMLLPPEAMDWLAETLDGGPEEVEAKPQEFLPPSVPEAVSTISGARAPNRAAIFSRASSTAFRAAWP